MIVIVVWPPALAGLQVEAAARPVRPEPAAAPGTTPPAQSIGTTNIGPLSLDGKTAYITVRFDVQPSTLGDDYLHGVD
ncbi:hypothetical protein [Streptomyces sp. NBC_01361]|uniref:hypothetical protein n=1 Tax=Streptomyces sp. NBC_01361 TaxID=2903838 RepID=UPI002E36B300|nr:hypothetical protein [Streptomyces sp. NBC_01361]